MSVHEESQTQLNAALLQGLRSLDRLHEITFTRYRRFVLPVDGFVFWIKKSLINNPSGALNSFGIGANPLNTLQTVTSASDEFKVEGSFHYLTNNVQENTQIFGKNQVTFVTDKDIDDFNDIGENELFIGTYNDVQFSFSQRGQFYTESGLYHYTGEAINPIMRSQIIDDLTYFDSSKIVVDSLPVWMSLNKFCPVYPAYRGLQNARPPFISVEVVDTKPLQMTPIVDRYSNRDQLCLDTVELTCYGLNNNALLDYIHYVVIEEALKYGNNTWGISNSPTQKTINTPQSELNLTANAKKITFEINYYQTRIIDIARQLILEAFCSVGINYSGD